jgi:hypothetical protein
MGHFYLPRSGSASGVKKTQLNLVPIRFLTRNASLEIEN